MWKKLMLLWKIRKPVEDVSKDLKEIKRGYKSVAFWLVLVGHLGALAAAAQGALDPKIALIANTVLAVLYNVLRASTKSQETGVREYWKTTEFYITVGSQLSAGLMALQAGGLDAKWITVSLAVLNGVAVFGRDMSHKQPEKPNEPGK
jgi:hypothetical protein